MDGVLDNEVSGDLVGVAVTLIEGVLEGVSCGVGVIEGVEVGV